MGKKNSWWEISCCLFVFVYYCIKLEFLFVISSWKFC